MWPIPAQPDPPDHRAGVVTTLAGDTNFGYADGSGTNAWFDYPEGAAVDGSGNIYVADSWNNLIRKIIRPGW